MFKLIFVTVLVACVCSENGDPTPAKSSELRIETTTHKYPTATWSAGSYDKKKKIEDMWKLYLFKPSPFLKPPFIDGETGAAITRIEDGLEVNGRRRGRPDYPTRRITPEKFNDNNAIGQERNHPPKPSKLSIMNATLHDNVLEEALQKYIKSANLTDEFGTITLEMFTEALNKIIAQKKQLNYSSADGIKQEQHPENDTKVRKISPSLVEKPFWEVINENISVPSRNAPLDPIEDWKPVDITTRIDTTTEADIKYSILTQSYPTDASTVQVLLTTSAPPKDTSVKPKKPSRGSKKYRDTQLGKSEKKEQLVAEESVYYGSRQQLIAEPRQKEKSFGAIPGLPDVDYPRLSSPPKTDFKCPRVEKGISLLVADPKTRCQVFYNCASDAPPTPMLCPNGTVFNSQVLVCDWWFNVDC